jgi:nucleotide-binding universal stress UspA family protein
MNRILVAIDDSTGARAAVEQALALALDTGARITFLAVRERPRAMLGAPYWQVEVSQETARLRPVLEAAVAEAEGLGLEAEYELLEGDAAHEIVHLARSRNVDLIVVGSRGYGAIASALLGSVSRRVVGEADRPVLVAKERSTVAAVT